MYDIICIELCVGHWRISNISHSTVRTTYLRVGSIRKVQLGGPSSTKLFFSLRLPSIATLFTQYYLSHFDRATLLIAPLLRCVHPAVSQHGVAAAYAPLFSTLQSRTSRTVVLSINRLKTSSR
jgi:hypothetical protein